MANVFLFLHKANRQNGAVPTTAWKKKASRRKTAGRGLEILIGIGYFVLRVFYKNNIQHYLLNFFPRKSVSMQFEIVDAREVALNDRQRSKGTMLIKDADGSINGKPTYARICIKRIGE